MSKILIPQRGILHDRVDEGWIVPMVRRPTSTASGRAIAAILPRLVAEGRLIPAMGYVALNGVAMAAVIDSETALSAVVASPMAMEAVAASSTAMAAVAASSTAMAAVIGSQTALSAVVASPTAMAAVAASETAMAAVAASETAMAAVFGTTTPNYMAREKVWDSEIATDAVLGDGRAWLVANVQTESSQTVLAQTWWNYSGSRKALVLQACANSTSGFKLRYTRNGEETALYNPGQGIWVDINIAMYSSAMYNQSSSGRTLLVRWVRMQA